MSDIGPQRWPSSLQSVIAQTKRVVRDLEWIRTVSLTSAQITAQPPVDSHLADAFRELRNEWFNANLWVYPRGKREGQESNDRLRTVYDTQTEAIIAGAEFPVAPRRGADMEASQ